MTQIIEEKDKKTEHTMSIFLNFIPNFSPQEIEQMLRAEFEFNLREKIKRCQEMKGKAAIFPDKHFSHCVLEIQDAYVCGHFFLVIGGCQSLIEAMMRDLAKSIGGNWEENFSDKVDQLEKRMDSIPKTLFEKAKNIYDDRNDYHHLNPTVPLEHQKLANIAKEKISLSLECMNILYPFKTENGSLVPQSKLWHTNRPKR